jgi:hypothetical protein
MTGFDLIVFSGKRHFRCCHQELMRPSVAKIFKIPYVDETQDIHFIQPLIA